ncbi:hypothetical protein PAEVO_21730 [Paenibacillus sp. GM2FR]|uniref:hypothetical protein n=1 Tax=Paenibacillus sp. GM2FR TaxID=2059268 RepID=UPI000C278E0D|nr:hypothetical protein [Paenibacillus sp. GM2FR]PJN55452.1 hypothetical protein PAEVO_21730 [Paenibacillus sp. GM2FR]
MNEWKPEWNKRLAEPPFKEPRFKADMMDDVEKRLMLVDMKRTRRGWRRAAVAIVPVLLLLLGIGIWFGNLAPSIPDPAAPSPGTQGGGTFESSFLLGAGGDFDWWNLAKSEVKQDNDRTIVTLAAALLQRELGIWGGPSPDIWEHSEVKWPLDRYDVSSPWVYEVHVKEINAEEAQTVYRLRLLLRDSIPMTYEETIDVTIRNDSHKISLIEQINIDETGAPLEEFKTGDEQGKPVILKEDAQIGLKMTGTLIQKEGMIRSIHVQYGDMEHTFHDWKNVSNESYFPDVALLPARNNKEDVLAIILTTGYGTSVRESVLKLLTVHLREVMSADPVLAVKSRLSYKATAEAGERIFQFTLVGVTRTFEYNEEDAGFWLDQPALGNMVRYYVEGGILYASVPIQVSPGEFPVAVRLRYEYDGTAFLVSEAMFAEM